jgi:hypothetical protein
MALVNLLNGSGHHSLTRCNASNRLRGRCFSRPLVLEALESRWCPALLTLTPASVNAGFRLTNFVTNFPPTPQNIGPLGIAFPDSDHVLVSNAYYSAVTLKAAKACHPSRRGRCPRRQTKILTFRSHFSLASVPEMRAVER